MSYDCIENEVDEDNVYHCNCGFTFITSNDLKEEQCDCPECGCNWFGWHYRCVICDTLFRDIGELNNIGGKSIDDHDFCTQCLNEDRVELYLNELSLVKLGV